MMMYTKELISNVWTSFCVEDYIQSEDTDFQVAEKRGTKKRVPTMTIPVPFQTVIRGQKKKEEVMTSKSGIEIVHELLKSEEDSEGERKSRAHPVPGSVRLPLHHELVKQNKGGGGLGRRKTKKLFWPPRSRLHSLQGTEASGREKQLRDLYKPKRKHRFKARPIPPSVYSSATSEKLKEELLRNLRTQLRAQQLLQNSSPLPYKPGHKHVRNLKGPEQARKLRNKHKARSQTPNVESLPEEYKKHFSEHKYPKLPTVRRPLNVCASSSKSAERENVLANEENVKETHCPCLSPRHSHQEEVQLQRPRLGAADLQCPQCHPQDENKLSERVKGKGRENTDKN